MAERVANLAQALVDRRVERGHGHRSAIRASGRTYTYLDLQAWMNRCGNALQGLGIERRDRVALILLDTPEFIAGFLGAVKIGAVPVPMSTLLRTPDYRYMLADSRARVAIVSAPLLSQVAGLRAELPSLEAIVVASGPASGEVWSLEALCAAAPTSLATAPTGPDDWCFWQYSSGTTGTPKAAVHLQHDLFLTGEAYAQNVLAMTSDDRSFSIAKLSFSFGLTSSLTHPLWAGATTLLWPERPEPRTVFEFITRERPTLFYAVPTAYAAMLAVPAEDFPYDLSSIRHCVSAGEALPKAVWERWRERFGLEILDGVGSTEIGYICISNFPGRVRPGTSGQVIPGYEAKVADADGIPVPTGETGDLWVRGDSTFASYWDQPEKTKSAIRDGWTVTGDRYAVDADGYFTYAGRGDDMLKVGGSWVSPIEIEGALIEHPSVLECGVVGQEDADGLTKPAAYVVLQAGVRPTERLVEELQAFVRERLLHYKYPRWIHFIDELPKTVTGKIQRFKLRSR